MKFILTIAKPTPSLNDFHHKHWRVEHTAKKRWHRMIVAAAGDALPFFKANGKRRLTVQRFSSGMLDIDNFIGGLKYCVIDRLRALELLVDDTAAMFELVPEQVKIKRGQPQHTVLMLEDI